MATQGRPPLPPELKRVAVTYKLRKAQRDRVKAISKIYGITQTAVIEAAIMQYKPPGKR